MRADGGGATSFKVRFKTFLTKDLFSNGLSLHSYCSHNDKQLTRILEDSLGGNCKTTMMAMVSPALEAILESVSTLKFANHAKNIKNEARINEDMDQRSLLRKYERELKHLAS